MTDTVQALEQELSEAMKAIARAKEKMAILKVEMTILKDRKVLVVKHSDEAQ